jgi:hypothetical protein
MPPQKILYFHELSLLNFMTQKNPVFFNAQALHNFGADFHVSYTAYREAISLRLLRKGAAFSSRYGS